MTAGAPPGSAAGDGVVLLRAKTERLGDLGDRFAHLGRKRRKPASVAAMHRAVEAAVAAATPTRPPRTRAPHTARSRVAPSLAT